MNNYDAIRKIIYESLKNDPESKDTLFQTLKWIVYEKWSNKRQSLEAFQCPSCVENIATLGYDKDKGFCPGCNEQILLTDMLGFHLDMLPDMATEGLANTYMIIHETLFLFTGIRLFWEKEILRTNILPNSLFIKDGPLSIRAQYSKIVAPIRRFLEFAKNEGISVHVIGQEKTGTFVDHLELVGSLVSDETIFYLGNKYIREEIQRRPNRGTPYGRDTYWGSKIFLKISEFNKFVLTIPTGLYKSEPKASDYIGLNRIIATIPDLLSNRFEGALYPIELANGIASLSTYPSAKILQMFVEDMEKLILKQKHT